MRRGSDLTDCAVCPRECRVNRLSGRTGYCRADDGLYVAAICAHYGEEPVVSGSRGICNVFFCHCNMQCLYCQNHQISRNTSDLTTHRISLDDATRRIEEVLSCGSRAVGFVSPSHCIPQMNALIARLRTSDFKPVFVMNTNAHDKVETIRSLEEKIDVYLPDLKYMDRELAGIYSGAPDYPETATAAIREMFRQKGPEIMLDAEGNIRSGLIIRHLVLPGHTENSRRCLEFIARELSPDVHLSLMSQYRPTPHVASHEKLGRSVSEREYAEIAAFAEQLGFHNGWTQDIDSKNCYAPDFSRSQPFC